MHRINLVKQLFIFRKMIKTINVFIQISTRTKHKNIAVLNAVAADEDAILFIDNSNASESNVNYSVNKFDNLNKEEPKCQDTNSGAAVKEMTKEALEEEARIQQTLLDIKKKFGKNAVVMAMNLEEDATAMSRNKQIGGPCHGKNIETQEVGSRDRALSSDIAHKRQAIPLWEGSHQDGTRRNP